MTRKEDIKLEELAQAGVHFGHQTKRWHPKMKPFIFGSKNNIHILDLEQTQVMLKEAAKFLEDQAAAGKTVLFLGTKKQVKEAVKNAALKSNSAYIIERWLGGTVTNFISIRNLIKRLKRLKDQRETGELKKYTKKEQLDFEKEIVRLEKLIGGIQELNNIPDVLVIIGVREEKIALAEAVKRKIPIVALVDSNIDPTQIDYAIPANDDGVKSVELITDYLAEAVKAGRDKQTVNPKK